MHRAAILTSVACLALFMAACGGETPSSPNAGGGVQVNGVVLGGDAVISASSGRAVASAGGHRLTVQVADTSIEVEVEENGTFTLEAPGGKITLIYLLDGVEIGRVQVEAEEGSQVRVVVQVEDSVLKVVEIQVMGSAASPSPSPSPSPAACIIGGGVVYQKVELEGNVTEGGSDAFTMTASGVRGLVDVVAGSASYRCIGNAKAPSDEECKGSLRSGSKVHVRGTLTTCTTTSAEVAASEVKIQK